MHGYSKGWILPDFPVKIFDEYPGIVILKDINTMINGFN